jgi:hypothetical protein
MPFLIRVALIANEANVNEHTDPKIVIAGLRQQIDILKAELRNSGKEPDEPARPLEPEEIAMYVSNAEEGKGQMGRKERGRNRDYMFLNN